MGFDSFRLSLCLGGGGKRVGTAGVMATDIPVIPKGRAGS